MTFTEIFTESDENNPKTPKTPKDSKTNNSTFDQTGLKPVAEKWLKKKFGDRFEFVHTPNLVDSGESKTYHCSQDNKNFTIVGRKYETEVTNPVNKVAYKILPAEEEEEEAF